MNMTLQIEVLSVTERMNDTLAVHTNVEQSGEWVGDFMAVFEHVGGNVYDMTDTEGVKHMGGHYIDETPTTYMVGVAAQQASDMSEYDVRHYTR